MGKRIDTRKGLVVLHLAATNDTNGNPRRLYAVIEASTGCIIDAIDEGYTGPPAWRARYPNAVESVRIDVTPREYRETLKRFR